MLVGENDHYKPLAVSLRRLLAEGAIGEMVFAHFTTIAQRLKTADDWRNDESMAGGDAFFEEGIHWLHLAGSLGPTITSIHGFRPSLSRDGPDRRAKSMMVAFQYDNGAVGSLYYSREIPSLLQGPARCRSCIGREGIITFESNGGFVLVRGRGLPRLLFPGFRDIRGYQAMYRDFVRAIRDGARAGDEPRARDRGSAPDGSDLRQRRIVEPMTDRAHRYDIVIIGSGAGGGTMAHALAETGARILVARARRLRAAGRRELEPGGRLEAPALPHHRAVARSSTGESFRPYTHYCVGGNTKFWGSVLYRLRREDFGALEHVDGVSPAWPIDYETLAPYYDRAERLYHVHGEAGVDPTEPPRGPYPVPAGPARRRHAGDRRRPARGRACIPSPLPLGLLEPGERGGCVLCNTCNSFPCKLRAKSDADVCCVRPALQQPNVTLWTERLARRA